MKSILTSDLSSPETIETIIWRQDSLEEILEIKNYILDTIDFEAVQYTEKDILRHTNFENLSLLLYNYQENNITSDKIIKKHKKYIEKKDLSLISFTDESDKNINTIIQEIRECDTEENASKLKIEKSKLNKYIISLNQRLKDEKLNRKNILEEAESFLNKLK